MTTLNTNSATLPAVSSPGSSLYSDLDTLAGLRRSARANEEGALAPVAAQFEALFIQSMLKSMRDAVPDGGLFDRQRMQTYQQMYDTQLALELSAKGGIGLAEVMVQQLQARGVEPAGSDGALTLPQRRAFPAAATDVAMPSAATGTSGVPAAGAASWRPDDKAAFVAEVRQYAEAAAASLGVDADILVAQAALETGWGQHTLPKGAGSSFNLFNIKAGGDWLGAVTETTAVEYEGGQPVMRRSRFRAYNNLAEAFADYTRLIGGAPRYQRAVAGAADAEVYVRELQAAGYATDPAYADKVLAVARQLPGESLKQSLNFSG
ncbi:MAG: flagellar assembly peptidoglycan hydrolase FlgJ [Parahaliea sp.]